MDSSFIYLQEARTQANFALRSYTSFREAKNSSDVISVFYHLHHFLVHAIAVHRIVAPTCKRNAERKQLLQGLIDLSDTDLTPFQKLRNHLEHFDERLDKWVEDLDGHAYLDMNLVTGTKGYPEHAFLRALDGNHFKFYGESYDMTELHLLLLEISRRLSVACER